MKLENTDIEGKYEILEKMREGGMGALYKVRHRLLDDIRVIKVIRPQFAGQAELDQRFRLEARTAIRLRHPNIAQIYDFSVAEDSTAFIVMEFIDGMTFQEMLAAGGPRDLSLTLELARQGLRALSYLHHRGYVHRDIASDNLMLTRDFDGSPLVKLIDLGIVKRLTGQAGITATGTFMGKARYSAPEHFSSGGGSAKVDAKSDLYSYGVLLYELLTGEFPVVGNDFSEIIAGHLFRPPRPFSETDPQGRIAPELAQLVIVMLDKAPDRRIASADELAEKLSPFQQRNKEELAGELGPVLAREAPAADSPAASSTTRRRLEQVFVEGTTPQPAPLASLPEDNDDTRQRKRRQIAALLDDARLLAQLDQKEPARVKVQELLALEPDHTEASRFLGSLEAAAPAGRPKARPAAKQTSGASPKPSAPRPEKPIPPPLQTRPKPAQPKPPRREAAEAQQPARVAAATIIADLEAGRLTRAREELALARTLYGRDPALDDAERRLARSREPLPDTETSSPPVARTSFLRSRSVQAAAGLAAVLLLAAILVGRGKRTEPPDPEAAAVAETAAESAGAGSSGGDARPGGGPEDGPAATAETGTGPVAAGEAASTLEASAGPLGDGKSEAKPPPPSAVAGTLLLDALPWGKVRSVTSAAGRVHPLGRDPYTPLRLTLPPGRYAIDMIGRSGPQRDPIEIEIRPGEVAERLVDLGRTDTGSYFRQAGF